MTKLVIPLIVIESALLAGPLLASSAAALPSAAEGDQVRLETRKYVRCVVASNFQMRGGRGIVAYLRADSTSRPDAERAKDALETCEGRRSLKVPDAVLRGQMFRALYVEDWGIRSGMRYADAIRDIARSPVPVSAEPMRKFGMCVIARDFVNSDRLVRLFPGSAPEEEAYTALSEAFASCIEAGSIIRFSRSIIEGALSEALFVQRIQQLPTANQASSH